MGTTLLRLLLVAGLGLTSTFALTGCERNSGEKAADAVGDAADDVGDAVEDAADDVKDAVD
jgi:hypothetical protein